MHKLMVIGLCITIIFSIYYWVRSGFWIPKYIHYLAIFMALVAIAMSYFSYSVNDPAAPKVLYFIPIFPVMVYLGYILYGGGFVSRERTMRRRCNACDCDGIDGSIFSQYKQIKFVKKLKRGKLYICEKCNNSWYLKENEEWLNRIPKEYESLVDYWNENKINISESNCQTLREIGGVAHNSMDGISFPCCVVETNGNVVEPSIVVISKSPPCNWLETDLIKWTSEIKEIRTSPFALSREIRVASNEKREERMGFAPVSVQDNSGKHFTLGNASEWFNSEGVLGKDLKLSERPGKWRNIVNSQEPQAYYFADWFDGCESLIIKADRTNQSS